MGKALEGVEHIIGGDFTPLAVREDRIVCKVATLAGAAGVGEALTAASRGNNGDRRGQEVQEEKARQADAIVVL